MNTKTITIPSGCLEVLKPNYIKVDRVLIDNEPKKNEIINIFMEGTGYSYHGEIYHKNKDYCYIYLY